MKRFLFLLAVSSAALTVCTGAHAVGRLADVTVTDRATGSTLPVHYHRGEYWVAGLPGAKYAIAVRSASGERLLAVTSVDGINVLSGETAAVAQSGYVFDAWQRYDITGWRKSDADVAAFEFTASPNSYAERTGRPRDVGVIGVALFKERLRVMPQPYPQISPASPAPAPLGMGPSDTARGAHDTSSARAAASAEAAGMPATQSTAPAAESRADSMTKSQGTARPQAAPKLGTGHGERESSYVSRTQFERAQNTPHEVIRIRYDSRDNLVAMGVIPAHQWPQMPRPNPFPDSPPVGYVPDPPHWR